MRALSHCCCAPQLDVGVLAHAVDLARHLTVAGGDGGSDAESAPSLGSQSLFRFLVTVLLGYSRAELDAAAGANGSGGDGEGDGGDDGWTVINVDVQRKALFFRPVSQQQQAGSGADVDDGGYVSATNLWARRREIVDMVSRQMMSVQWMDATTADAADTDADADVLVIMMPLLRRLRALPADASFAVLRLASMALAKRRSRRVGGDSDGAIGQPARKRARVGSNGEEDAALPPLPPHVVMCLGGFVGSVVRFAEASDTGGAQGEEALLRECTTICHECPAVLQAMAERLMHAGDYWNGTGGVAPAESVSKKTWDKAAHVALLLARLPSHAAPGTSRGALQRTMVALVAHLKSHLEAGTGSASIFRRLQSEVELMQA